MTLEEFKETPENTLISVNGRPYLLWTNVGFMVHDEKTIRIQPMDVPKAVRGNQYHDMYLAGDKNQSEFLQENVVTLMQKEEQLKLF